MCFVLKTLERTLTDRTRARDYHAEYHAAVEAYAREIEKAVGFAFMPEHDDKGKDATPGSALRQAYDAMVEAEREQDERHPPGTWIG